MEQVAQTVIEYKAAIVVLWLLLFLGAERLLPATTRPDDERRVGRNAGLWLVNTVMSVMIILPLSAGFRAGVIIALDMPFASIVVFEALVLLAAVFHHSNLRLPAALERALGWLVVTPAIHWVHHHAVDRDTRSNYATILSLWDPLGGTRSATRRHEAMPIGLPEAGDQAVGALLLRPFRRR